MLSGSDAPLIVVASDGLYNDVLAQGYHGLPSSAFTPIEVQVKTFTGRGWIYLPGAQPQQVRHMPSGSLNEFLEAPRDTW
jgi:hypothetical protein